MNISGIVEIGSEIKFKPKKGNKDQQVLDYAKFTANTYNVNADGEVKKDKNGLEIIDSFELRVYGKFATHLKKLVKTDQKDLTGYKIWIKRAELRDKIKTVEEEDGKVSTIRNGKYIKVFKAELVSKKVKNPELFITTTLYVTGKKPKNNVEVPAVEEKEVKGNSHLLKASFNGAFYHYVDKENSEPVFMSIDSMDSVEDGKDRYANKTGLLIKHVKAKQQILITGSLRQSEYEDKNTGDIKQWFSINLESFNFVSSGGKAENTDNLGKAEDFDDEDDDDDFGSYATPKKADPFDAGNDDDLIGEDEIPF